MWEPRLKVILTAVVAVLVLISGAVEVDQGTRVSLQAALAAVLFWLGARQSPPREGP